MSVEITFEDEGHNGLVAEGTYLWEAAKRLGVPLPADCNGRGECDSCAVVIVQGVGLLSSSTDSEHKILGEERLARAERLACQTRLEGTGEVIVRTVAQGAEKKNKYRRRLRDKPLNQQVSSLIEIEATAALEALNAVRGKYVAFVEKLLNLTPPRKSSNQHGQREGNTMAGVNRKAQAGTAAEKKD